MQEYINNNNNNSDITSSPAKMNVNQLNDDSLLLIFKKLPIQELLRHRLVCARWQLLIEQLCAGRRSLKLFSGFQNVYQYANDLVNFCLEDAEHLKLRPAPPEDDDLLLALEPAVGRLIGDLFTNVDRLVVHLNADSAVHLPSLLQCLSSRLQLLLALSTLRQLQHLELFSEPNYSTNQALVLSHQFGPIVSKLESFAVSGFQADVVALLGEAGRLKRLTLDRLPLPALQQLLEVNNRRLESTLTHLSVDDLQLDSLQFICEHFASLESLEIGLDDQLDPQQREALPPLANIKSVTIFKLNIFSHSVSGPNHIVQTLATLFPNAEAIYLRNENPRHTPALLAGIVKADLSFSELEYLKRYQFYATAEMKHAGRHAERCRREKRSRKERMWDYEEDANGGNGNAAAAPVLDRFDHNARLGRLSIGQAILARRVNPALFESGNAANDDANSN
ncbi:hypothetical protein TYRP_012037 [Tyrophagus putrescentiae]|nr:hypothetical protein TYRP_012037 [Tyrophagus putrescentiae]